MNSLGQATAELQRQNWFFLIGLAIWPVGVLIHLWIAKRIEAKVANHQHFNRLRYEHELALYRDVWQKLCTHSENSFGRSLCNDKDPEAQLKAKTLKDSGRNLFETIRDNRPFYPAEICAELQKFLDVCDSMANAQARIESAGLTGKAALGQRIETDESEVRTQIRRIEDAIRQRLNKFDGA